MFRKDPHYWFYFGPRSTRRRRKLFWCGIQLNNSILATRAARKLHPSSSAAQITPWQAGGASWPLHKRNEMERLHPPSHKATVDKQARLLEFGEDVPASLHYAVARKKRLRLLSEVVPLAQWSEDFRLRPTGYAVTSASSFAIFLAVQKCSYGIAFISFRLSRILAKKMAAGNFYLPPPFWKAFWGEKLRISLWNEILKIASLLQRKTQNTLQLPAVSVVHNTWLSRNLVAFLSKFRLCAWFFSYDDVYLF